MAKIGILTYHRATNYGAVLQAYSLSNRIMEDFPEHDVEIIDYSTQRAKIDHIKEVLYPIKNMGLHESIAVHKKNRMFNKFSNEVLQLSNRKIIDDRIDGVSDYIEREYDCIISGSDAVFSWNGKLFPTAYLLGNCSSCSKISYAASAHRLFYKDQNEERIEYCRKTFESFKYIGVRDSETERFVKYCSKDVETHHNCDPTFLLDVNKLHMIAGYDSLLERFGIMSKKPIAILMSPDEEVGKIVNQCFGATHTIIALFVRNKYADLFLPTLSPFEWASIFGLAKITITEYFHATILSLLNNTPVVAIDKLSNRSGYEGKISDLMINRLALDEMYINIEDIRQNGYDMIAKRMQHVMSGDYSDYIKQSVQKEKTYYEGFKEFLKTSI